MNAETKSKLLNSIAGGRLVIFSGAGLSMAAPSSVPSAVRLADQCVTAYERVSGESLSESFRSDIEALADYFEERHELQTTLLNTVLRQVDISAFFRNPNAGHEAIADFLGCGAIELNISTNVDDLTERAAETLGEPIATVAVDRHQAATPSDHRPHVKLHGCFRRNVADTLWCQRQLQNAPFDARIREFREWLPGVLQQKDLVFVGFWSDWGYLNNALEEVLSETHPNRIVLVNPDTPERLEEKARRLWELAHSDGVEFIHVQQSGAEFLDELRRGFSVRFMKRLFSDGKQSYAAMEGRQSTIVPDFDSLSTADLYQMRRDATCTSSDKIVRMREPNSTMALLGAAHIEMVEAGATLDGPSYRRSGQRVRLVHGAGQLISEVRNKFSRSDSIVAADVVVCVGARPSSFMPDNVAIGNKTDSIVRPGLQETWMTDDESRNHFADPVSVPIQILSAALPLAANAEE